MPNEGDPRLILRLDPLIRSGLQARAMSEGVSLNELAKLQGDAVRYFAMLCKVLVGAKWLQKSVGYDVYLLKGSRVLRSLP